MQALIPILSELPRPKMADEYLVHSARDLLHAVRLMIQSSGYTDETVCAVLGIDKGHFSRMMNGRANLPLNKLRDAMTLCGSLLPVQVMARDAGAKVFEDAAAKERAELVARLAALDRKAA